MYWYGITIICILLLTFGFVVAYVSRLIINYSEKKYDEEREKERLEYI